MSRPSHRGAPAHQFGRVQDRVGSRTEYTSRNGTRLETAARARIIRINARGPETAGHQEHRADWSGSPSNPADGPRISNVWPTARHPTR